MQKLNAVHAGLLLLRAGWRQRAHERKFGATELDVGFAQPRHNDLPQGTKAEISVGKQLVALLLYVALVQPGTNNHQHEHRRDRHIPGMP